MINLDRGWIGRRTRLSVRRMTEPEEPCDATAGEPPPPPPPPTKKLPLSEVGWGREGGRGEGETKANEVAGEKTSFCPESLAGCSPSRRCGALLLPLGTGINSPPYPSPSPATSPVPAPASARAPRPPLWPTSSRRRRRRPCSTCP